MEKMKQKQKQFRVLIYKLPEKNLYQLLGKVVQGRVHF